MIKILSGDFKIGDDNSFDGKKLILLKKDVYNLREEIGVKDIASVTVKKVEGSTRGLVPFECKLTDGRSFIAETDINTYKILLVQASENKKTQQQTRQNNNQKTITDGDGSLKSEIAKTHPVFKIIGALLIALFIVSQCDKSKEIGKYAEASTQCQKAIKRYVVAPSKTSIPHVKPFVIGEDYSFGWTNEKQIQTKNRMGLDVFVSAQCIYSENVNRVTYLSIDDKVFID